jgi:alcohol dehydrogenase class IV
LGPGRLAELGSLLKGYGPKLLLVTGAKSFVRSPHYLNLLDLLDGQGRALQEVRISGEPSPAQVDAAVGRFGSSSIDLVLAVGGGSVIDAGKAIAAMLPMNEPVSEYLEGVGSKRHPGVTKPLIAVPTTAGTGAEATKNAVLSEVGRQGFKKSLRHDCFIPEAAVIDPLLFVGTPLEITAACGMDAMTQLLESYVSVRANPLTDALSWSGLKALIKNLIPACTDGNKGVEVWSGMAYGAFLSGVTLAHAGLGVVHGFASPIGGFFNVPHGVVCGTLLASSVKVNLDFLRSAHASNEIALHKYAQVGRLMSGNWGQTADSACDALVQRLQEWTEELQIPRLARFGMTQDDVRRIVRKTSQKNNPVELDRGHLLEILSERI